MITDNKKDLNNYKECNLSNKVLDSVNEKLNDNMEIIGYYKSNDNRKFALIKFKDCGHTCLVGIKLNFRCNEENCKRKWNSYNQKNFWKNQTDEYRNNKTKIMRDKKEILDKDNERRKIINDKISIANKGKPKSYEHVQHMKDYYANLTIEEKENISKKLSKGQRLFYQNEIEEHKMKRKEIHRQAIINMSKEKKEELYKKVSIANKGKPKSELHKQHMRDYWNNLDKSIKSERGKLNNFNYWIKQIPELKILYDKDLCTNYIKSLKTKPTYNDLQDYFHISPRYIKNRIIEYNLEDCIVNSNRFHISNFQIEIIKYIKSLGINIDNKNINTKSIIPPLELDIYIPEYKLAIECNGLYWHQLNRKDKEYHYDKTQKCIEKGIKLIHIWDFEWNNPELKIKLMKLLKRYLNNNLNIIYARKCIIKEIDKKEANNFINLYHLQSSCLGNKINLGLYYNDELVEIMTFGNPRYNKNYQYELLRLCTKFDYLVVGGAQKLFSYFINTYNPNSIISYCDINKFSGDIYIKLNMLYKGHSLSKYWYNYDKDLKITDNLLRQRGFDQLFKTNFGKGTSNEELMIKEKFIPYYDSGQNTYIWKKN